jgi:transposase
MSIQRSKPQGKGHAILPSHYSHHGRTSIDPELMIRILLVGYCYGIRSERRLCVKT